MAVVGEAGTVAEALAGIPGAHPDVALLDLRLPDGSGVEVCRELHVHHPDVRCLMLTSYADDAALVDAIAAGASGYVHKDVGSGELLAAVRKVAAGAEVGVGAGAGAGAEAGAEVGAGVGAGGFGDDRSAGLTEQERRILVLIGEGLTNRAIGQRLHLAEKTIKNYVSGLLAKLGMERRSQAAAYVARLQAQAHSPAHSPAPSPARPSADSPAGDAGDRKAQPQNH